MTIERVVIVPEEGKDNFAAAAVLEGRSFWGAATRVNGSIVLPSVTVFAGPRSYLFRPGEKIRARNCRAMPLLVRYRFADPAEARWR